MTKNFTQWQIDDAERLRIIFEAHGESQAAFGEKTGIGSQGMVWQYLSCTKALNLSAVIKFANGLNVTVDEISPTLAAELREARLQKPISSSDKSMSQFSKLTPENKWRVLERIELLLESQQHDKKSGAGDPFDATKKSA